MKFFAVILGILVFVPILALPQDRQRLSAKFKGIIVNASIVGIPKASVIVEGNGKKWVLETNANEKTAGEFAIDLPAGKYKFTIEKRGFKRLVIKDFCVASGAIITYEFKMEFSDCDDCDLIDPKENAVLFITRRPTNQWT